MILGAVNYYKSLWPRCAHILAPLGECTGENPFSYDVIKKNAFKDMKTLMLPEWTNKSTDYTKPFHIVTDAPKYQHGVPIIKKGHPILN